MACYRPLRQSHPLYGKLAHSGLAQPSPAFRRACTHTHTHTHTHRVKSCRKNSPIENPSLLGRAQLQPSLSTSPKEWLTLLNRRSGLARQFCKNVGDAVLPMSRATREGSVALTCQQLACNQGKTALRACNVQAMMDDVQGLQDWTRQLGLGYTPKMDFCLSEDCHWKPEGDGMVACPGLTSCLLSRQPEI